MSIIKHVTLQKIVAHDFRYDPRILLGERPKYWEENPVRMPLYIAQILHGRARDRSWVCSVRGRTLTG